MTEADVLGPKPVPPRPGLGAGRVRLAAALRVDHAGEVAAVQIYRGQRAVLGAAHGRTAAQLAQMQAQEARHLAAFEQILTRRGVRPTLLAPIWRAAGFALGAATALMGESAIHACTDAVEAVITDHYAGQIDELAEREPELAGRIAEFRDDEAAHREAALAEGAREAPAYSLLTGVIRAGCRIAIKLSEKL